MTRAGYFASVSGAELDYCTSSEDDTGANKVRKQSKKHVGTLSRSRCYLCYLV